MTQDGYTGVMVFCEQRQGIVSKVSYELIGKARAIADELGEKITAVLLGYNIKTCVNL